MISCRCSRKKTIQLFVSESKLAMKHQNKKGKHLILAETICQMSNVGIWSSIPKWDSQRVDQFDLAESTSTNSLNFIPQICVCHAHAHIITHNHTYMFVYIYIYLFIYLFIYIYIHIYILIDCFFCVYLSRSALYSSNCSVPKLETERFFHAFPSCHRLWTPRAYRLWAELLRARSAELPRVEPAWSAAVATWRLPTRKAQKSARRGCLFGFTLIFWKQAKHRHKTKWNILEPALFQNLLKNRPDIQIVNHTTAQQTNSIHIYIYIFIYIFILCMYVLHVYAVLCTYVYA